MAEVATVGTGNLNQGWCYLDTAGATPADVAGIAVFRNLATGQEVGVPASSQTSPALILAFDNRGGYSYGVAIVNPDENVCGEFSAPETVNVTFKDSAGVTFATDTLAIPGCGYAVFVLNQQFPITANQVGTATFAVSPPGLTLAGLGLRASPTGSLTSVDMFAPLTY